LAAAAPARPAEQTSTLTHPKTGKPTKLNTGNIGKRKKAAAPLPNAEAVGVDEIDLTQDEIPEARIIRDAEGQQSGPAEGTGRGREWVGMLAGRLIPAMVIKAQSSAYFQRLLRWFHDNFVCEARSERPGGGRSAQANSAAAYVAERKRIHEEKHGPAKRSAVAPATGRKNFSNGQVGRC